MPSRRPRASRSSAGGHDVDGDRSALVHMLPDCQLSLRASGTVVETRVGVSVLVVIAFLRLLHQPIEIAAEPWIVVPPNLLRLLAVRVATPDLPAEVASVIVASVLLVLVSLSVPLVLFMIGVATRQMDDPADLIPNSGHGFAARRLQPLLDVLLLQDARID